MAQGGQEQSRALYSCRPLQLFPPIKTDASLIPLHHSASPLGLAPPHALERSTS